MIHVQDKFLPEKIFKELQEYTNSNSFDKITAGDKEFSVLATPNEILQLLEVDSKEIIISFIRSAYLGFDDELRIHADNIIMGEKSERASVLYINDTDEVTENGTAFWCHNNYGIKLPKDISDKDFDLLLQNDSNDLEKWKQIGFIASVPNRLLTYDSNYFHSKYPNEIKKGVRYVLVTFYKNK